MIRAVLDANVVVSAILTPAGPPGRVLSAAHEGRVRLVASRPILQEIDRVLREPRLATRHGRSQRQIQELLRGLEAIAVMTKGESRFEIIEADPPDNRYLECAVEGRAGWIVTGDAHLLILREFRGIRIARPREFLSTLEGGGADLVREREAALLPVGAGKRWKRGSSHETRRRRRRLGVS